MPSTGYKWRSTHNLPTWTVNDVICQERWRWVSFLVSLKSLVLTRVSVSIYRHLCVLFVSAFSMYSGRYSLYIYKLVIYSTYMVTLLQNSSYLQVYLFVLCHVYKSDGLVWITMDNTSLFPLYFCSSFLSPSKSFSDSAFHYVT